MRNQSPRTDSDSTMPRGDESFSASNPRPTLQRWLRSFASSRLPPTSAISTGVESSERTSCPSANPRDADGVWAAAGAPVSTTLTSRSIRASRRMLMFVFLVPKRGGDHAPPRRGRPSRFFMRHGGCLCNDPASYSRTRLMSSPARSRRFSGMITRCIPMLVLMVTLGAGALAAQQPIAPDPAGQNSPGFPDGPQLLHDSLGQPFRVVPIKGLRQPWALAFLPNGDMLVTEMGGRLRIIRHGVLDPEPISGIPEANTRIWRGGLMDIAVHPRYTQNKFVYLTYTKSLLPEPGDQAGKPPPVAVALARGRFDGGSALTDVKDVFVSGPGCSSACASRVAFARDGTIIMTVGGGREGQNPASHVGKILRLN